MYRAKVPTAGLGFTNSRISYTVTFLRNFGDYERSGRSAISFMLAAIKQQAGGETGITMEYRGGFNGQGRPNVFREETLYSQILAVVGTPPEVETAKPTYDPRYKIGPNDDPGGGGTAGGGVPGIDPPIGSWPKPEPVPDSEFPIIPLVIGAAALLLVSRR